MMTAPLVRSLALPLFALTATAACAAKDASDPVAVPIAVEFPSAPAAVVTDNLRLFVFDGTMSCTDLLGVRKAGRPLPNALVERQATPFALARSRRSTFHATRPMSSSSRRR